VPYQTVLLDLDHTLLDSDASEAAAYEQTLRTVGIDDSATWFPTYRRINKAMWAEVEAGTMRPDDVRFRRFEAFNREVGIGADPVEMAEAFVHGLGANGDLYPGARDLLEAIAGRVALALLTNGISEVQRARVTRLDLEKYFDGIVISGEVGTSKPAAKIFDITFDRLGRPARDGAVMVGDSLTSDMAGGRAYGIATCWFNRNGRPVPDGAGLTHVVTDLTSIAEVTVG
jgi:YjjG family noncanonical pyrimidine nucleotidase